MAKPFDISKFVCSFVAIAICLNFSGCSTDEKKSDQAEGAFAIAKDFDDAERYDEAIKRYQEVKNKFPYSAFAAKAELAIADCYFKEESYAEAQVSYQSFRELHPKHEKMDYIVFRIASSMFNQLPSSIDRDLTIANDTIAQFTEVINKFPNSEFVKEASEKRGKARHMLAEKEQYIADFYFKRANFESALGRYEGLLKKFPDEGLSEHALSRAAIAAKKSGAVDKAKKYFAELSSKYPNSAAMEEAKKEMD